MKIFDSKEDVEYIAKSIDNKLIAENDYNLSVSSYVEAKDNREIVDITEVKCRNFKDRGKDKYPSG
jgi:type I restriction enzyme M protein